MPNKKKAKIAAEIMDAMHPDGPVNFSKETNRGARLAKKITNNAARTRVLRNAAKISKGINIAGFALAAGEGIYKGTKRALGPGGTQFHTGTGVPVWEDRNPANQNTKLNY